MEILGLIVSFLALGFSIFTYLKHDSKIKKQSALINQYQIDKINEEKEKSTRAIIEGNLIKQNKGKRVLKVYNKGKSTAKDVQVNFPDIKGLMMGSNPSPIEIRPQQSIDFDFFVSSGAPDIITIEFKWKDGFSSENFDKPTFQI